MTTVTIEEMKALDLKDKFLVINSDAIDMEALKSIRKGLVGAGCKGIMVLPADAKYDVKTKAELMRQIEAL